MKLIYFLLLLSLNVNAAWYASPTGTGNGSFSSPFGLQMAFQATTIKPGDTLEVIGGTYKGTFTISIAGTALKPIIIRPYNRQRVTIDGSLAGQTYKNKSVLTINGSYTWFMDIEVTNSDPERTIKIAGSNPIERRGGGIDVFGVGVKVINCIIYDVGQGLSWWTPALNSELYGNIVYNCGWMAPDREHGHGVYSQNNTGTKTLSNNIIFNNFSYELHIYGSDQSNLRNYSLEQNIFFNGHSVIGGGAPLDNIQVSGTRVYNDKPQFGYESKFNTGLKLTDNYFPNGVSLYWWKNVQVNNNWIFNTNKYSCALNILFNGLPDYSTFTFSGNNYYWSNPGPGYPAFLPLCWKNTVTGQENIIPLSGGTVTEMPMKSTTEFVLSGKKIFVSKNKYDGSRTTITVYNWDRHSTVDISIDSIINNGDDYVLRNAQDYFNDTVKGTYNGKLSLPMTGRSVAKPFGYASEIAPSTFPEFGVFILERKGLTQQPPPVIQPVPPPTQQPGDTIYIRDTIFIKDTIRIPGQNVTLSADAGKDTTVTGTIAYLKGKPRVTWKYALISGPNSGAWFTTPNAPDTKLNNLLYKGTYVVELTVTITDINGAVTVTKDRISIIKP